MSKESKKTRVPTGRARHPSKRAVDRIIVLGASAGGVESLKEVLCDLPADFPAAICVVLHVPAYQPSSLPEILSHCGHLKAIHPSDGTKIKAGYIYVAPP